VLNLGCGSAKIDGCINIDSEISCKPDLVLDFTSKPLPFEANSVKQVYFFHTIEHITKRLHRAILSEIHRVLEMNGNFYVSYPEFIKCAENWKANKGGLKPFWEATIFGRQLYASDYHVALMDSFELEGLLREIGFTHIRSVPEEGEEFNTITACRKGEPYIPYERLIASDMTSMILKK
jgi:predicted SAM-dependent methyltransferase